jgi:hypothetical protein
VLNLLLNARHDDLLLLLLRVSGALRAQKA